MEIITVDFVANATLLLFMAAALYILTFFVFIRYDVR
jgi:hypothetical protein